MDIKNVLGRFKLELDREIKSYFNREIEKEKKLDSGMADSLVYVKKLMLAGGKRLRPAFMYYGYLSIDGEDKEEVLKTSICIELVHLFLLVHDDVIDRDNMRHGMDTIAAHFEKFSARFFKDQDNRHFGDSMAIMLGDRLNGMGNQVLFESNFPSERIIKALVRLQQIVKMTVDGEKQDVCIGFSGKATEKEVMKMMEYKTARYTIEGPFSLGAILAGAPESFLRQIEKFAVPIGIAFQIQDDILGIYGDEEKLGKPVGSDIREGKITLLVVKVRELASKKDKKRFEEILGKRNVSLLEIEEFRKIVEECGSLEYSKKLAEKLIEKGKKEIKAINMKKESREFLLGIADYMIERNS